MAEVIEVRVPDIGDFAEVEVIEIHVANGDSVEVEESLGGGLPDVQGNITPM